MINCYDVLQLTVFTWLYSTHNLIIHPILVLNAFITAYYVLHVISVLFQYILLSYAHTLYARASSPFILHTYWFVFWRPWICTYRSLHVILLIRYLERITYLTRRRSSLNRSSPLGILLLSFTLSLPDILYIGLIAYSILLSICYHVWSFICYLTVVIMPS